MNDINDMNDRLLSDAGAERHGAILRNSTIAMTKHHRMRKRKRVVASCAFLVVIVGGAVVFSQSSLFSSTATIHKIAATETAIEEPALDRLQDVGGAAVRWRVVRSDSTAMEQYKVRATATVEHLNDVELARLLDSIDRPAGVISIGGQVRLTRSVVDESDGGVSESPM